MYEYCMHCSKPKGTSLAEMTSNSEKIKVIALSIFELCLFEGISQGVRLSGSVYKISLNKKKIRSKI